MTAELFVCTVDRPGMIVRLERTRRGWRQVDVASAAGVTQAEVSALERGQQVIPAVRLRIFRVLELDIQEI
jgi:transcriptional regulator with XRE-family HTH domain